MNKENIDITNVILKTKRLVLRAFKSTDLDDFYEYASVEGVGEMAGWRHHESKEKTLEILNLFIKEKKTFALVYDNKVIGSLGIERYNEDELKEFDSKLGRELGFVLAKPYWGKGLMAEAVNAVIAYLFNEEHLDFITCGHFVNNYQSFRVQEKCGFKHYKLIKFKTRMGNIEDTYLSILLKENYK